ncbi:MAG: phosphoglucosamine mutase [bacterium]|nr:phosphoglucosamine mutase [bacterium]
MTKLFGTDGIRGLVNDKSINSEMGFKVGWALVEFSKKINRHPKIIIARDTRGSGLMLEAALSAGIKANGGEVISAGIIPTPGLAFLIKSEKANAGVVISASHNDCAYNGFKIFKYDGTKLNDREEEEIENIILEDRSLMNFEINFSSQPADFFYRDEGLTNKYIDFLLNFLSKEINFKGMKVALDCANGSTYEVAPEIFRRLGAEVELNFAQPDGKNINANCGSQHTEALQAEVKNKKAQVGLAFDGDGDRLIAVAEDGKVLTGDQLIYIYSRLFLDQGWLKNDLVISTVMSNVGFINALRALGVAHRATDVGDRAVFFEMKRSGAVLGGEESGHIIFSGLHTTGDGILSALMLVWAMNHYNQSLSELAAQFTLAPKLLVNVEVKTKPELSSVAEIDKVIKEVENQLGGEGRILVRYSGTEPLCRVMIEGKNKNEISLLADRICRVINKTLG